MTLAELIYRESLDLSADKAQEVIDFIGLLKTRDRGRAPAVAPLDAPLSYEQARLQALAFLESPPLALNGRYWSRDSLYDRR